jgi:hypothetical protein
MRQLWEVADFVRTVRREMRFGELSRAPLRLLRLELREDAMECDWVARPPDVWDAGRRVLCETSTSLNKPWLTR